MVLGGEGVEIKAEAYIKHTHALTPKLDKIATQERIRGGERELMAASHQPSDPDSLPRLPAHLKAPPLRSTDPGPGERANCRRGCQK